MKVIDGIRYNFQGFKLGVKTPKLLFLGLIRIAVVIVFTVISASLILVYHQEILNFIWAKPESQWVVWLWHLFSWLLSIFLVVLSSVLSYLISQIFFCVIIMDIMSRITERMESGQEAAPEKIPLFRQLFYLIKQEIPRAIVPVVLSLMIIVLGWLTPLGPVITVISSVAAATFLAWDNTDLVPARRLQPFKARFRFLLKTLPFHIGFGLLFLIPVASIFFLSFAPVGATLYYIKEQTDPNIS
ncbi:MAG: EI24 domain-containing protein [Deltaproteobacteria bacterium]|nr:EI24 domain-containing protein [Deltaproteobacteria bacterium]